MKIPLSWLQQYIKLQHTAEEFGEIMTQLEFMQDGPIKNINDDQVIDLEVRQNRPDMLSIIGASREYAAFLREKTNEPSSIENIEIEWGEPNGNLSVISKDKVKRFCTFEIDKIKIQKSPEWMVKHLEAYGIPAINNIVDITNYVMIEYGLPLHAFDKSKLSKENGKPLLTIRPAKANEYFETWQKTQLSLSTKDIVVADNEKAVAIAGIIGGANSDIDNKTKTIILESACYDSATIRRTSIRHGITTEASLRHTKYQNPAMVKIALKRALYLIQTLAEGNLVKIEDFYPEKSEQKHIDFDLNEIYRLSGINIEKEQSIEILKSLGFEILEEKNTIGIGKDIITIGVPMWRTDINYEADLVEEVVRLWGYDKIPSREIDSPPPQYGTPDYLILEDIIKDVLVELGLKEYITNPLVKYSKNKVNQILLENPLNKEKDGLRTTIKETLVDVVTNLKKAGFENISIFESGNIYISERKGEYKEIKIIQSLYENYEFLKIKSDLARIVTTLNINDKLSYKYKKSEQEIEYYIGNDLVFNLFTDSYVIYLEKLVLHVDINAIPNISIKTSIPQKIEEEISLIIDQNQTLGELTESIVEFHELITEVAIVDEYVGSQIPEGKKSVTIKVKFEDPKNKMKQSDVEKIKNDFLQEVSKQYDAHQRL